LDAIKDKRAGVKVWAAAAILVIVVAGMIALRGLGKAGLEAEIAAIRKAGLPASPADLDRWYEHPEPSNNAALLVLEAAAEHVSVGGRLISYPAVGELLSPEMKKAMAEHIEENRQVIEKLHEAARLEESRYPINLKMGFKAPVTHLAQVRAMTQTLRYDAMLHAANQETGKAVNSVETSFALARTLRNEPLLISELVRISCVAISLLEVERLLSDLKLDEAQLEVLGRRLEEAEADGRRALFRAMAGERGGAIEEFLATWPGVAVGNTVSTQNIAIGALKVLGVRDRDLRLYLEMMEKSVSVSTNDFPEMLIAGERAEQEFVTRTSHGLGRFAVMTRMVIPAVNRAYIKEVALATRLRAARVAIAVEKFRLAHNGVLPRALADLVPDILQKPVVDPVFSKSFDYERGPTNAFQVVGNKPTNILSSPIVYQIYSSAAAKKLSNNLANAFVVRR
jgi:hypothetical protein